MSAVKSLFSTLFHVGLEKVGLDTTTKALILPHVPTVLDLCSNVTYIDIDKSRIEPYYDYMTYVIGIIFSIYAFYNYFNLIINYIFPQKPIKMPFDDTIEIKVANDIDAQSILYYIMNNADNNKLIRNIDVSKMQVNKNASAEQYSMMNSTSKELLICFMKSTYLTPNVAQFTYMIDSKKYKINSVDMEIKVSENSPKKNNDEEENNKDEKDNEKKEKEKEKKIKLLNKNKIDMSIRIKGLSKSTSNGISFYKDFCDIVRNYLKMKKNEEYGSIKQLEKVFIDPSTIQDNNKPSFLRDKNEMRLVFHDCPKNTTFDDRIELYLKTFINQSSNELERVLHEMEDGMICKNNSPLSQQNPSISLLVHGPPGSGKSTIPVIMAKICERNIVYLSLSDYYNFKQLRNAIIKNRTRSTVLVLDEIDKFINKLIDDKENPELVMPIEHKHHHLDGIVSPTCEPGTTNKDLKNELGDNMDTETKMVSNMVNAFNKVQNAKRIRKYNYDPEDLLPLFDDTCKVPGSITIATTNNPDVITNIGTGKTKGAMTRSGRLKLFRIGYFDKESLRTLFDIKYKTPIKINDNWFNELGEIKLQNSNLMDILRISTIDDIHKNIDQEIIKQDLGTE